MSYSWVGRTNRVVIDNILEIRLGDDTGLDGLGNHLEQSITKGGSGLGVHILLYRLEVIPSLLFVL